jgi:hypothetical protein
MSMSHVGRQSQPALSQTLGGWVSFFRELLSFLLESGKVFALSRAGFLGGKKRVILVFLLSGDSS